MEMDFSKLFELRHLLDQTPSGDFLTGYALLAFFLVLTFSSNIVRLISPDSKYFKKSIKGRLGKLIAVGIMGLVLVAARFSSVPFFSMRIFLLLTTVLGILFLLWTIFVVTSDYKKRKESAEREKRK